MVDNSAPKFTPPLQFILTETELNNLYSSVNFKVGDHTTKTQLRLSKSEREQITPEDVFEDCYLLTLRKGSLTILLEEISSDSSFRGRVPGIIVDGLVRGLKPRL
jgi:hypothetical protein